MPICYIYLAFFFQMFIFVLFLFFGCFERFERQTFIWMYILFAYIGDRADIFFNQSNQFLYFLRDGQMSVVFGFFSFFLSFSFVWAVFVAISEFQQFKGSTCVKTQWHSIRPRCGYIRKRCTIQWIKCGIIYRRCREYNGVVVRGTG